MKVTVLIILQVLAILAVLDVSRMDFWTDEKSTPKADARAYVTIKDGRMYMEVRRYDGEFLASWSYPLSQAGEYGSPEEIGMQIPTTVREKGNTGASIYFPNQKL